MSRLLRVLVVEDYEPDALLVLKELEQGGYAPAWRRVDAWEGVRLALEQPCTWEIVIVDYNLPGFSALDVLGLLQELHLDIPFIVVSGCIGEETAVAAMRAGAHDYLMKDNLMRLVPAVERELREAQDRQRRRQTEQTLRQMEEEKQRRELQAGFFSMMSHELKNPLGTIMAATELLEHYSQRTSEEKRQQYFHLIRQSVQRITALLNDTLVFGKAASGNLEFMPTLVDVESFCLRLVEEMHLIAGHPNAIALSCQGISIPLNLDSELLQHILGNLLSNALKYSPRTSQIQFAVTYQDDPASGNPLTTSFQQVFGADIPPPVAHHSPEISASPTGIITFRIQDQGIGIPPQDQQHLFDFFHRASNVGRIPGSGLGLAIVKQCVELHGGDITVESEVGLGTVFTVTLPVW